MNRTTFNGRGAITAAVICILVMLATAAQATAAPVRVAGSGWFWGDPFPQGETLTQVAFQGNRGYAVGKAGTVLRSDDGGAGWQSLISGTAADLSLLQMVDPNTIVIGGGCTVRESGDGGASFHRMAVDPAETGCPSPVAGLSFLSASSGYVELADGSVLQTADGGQTVQQRTAVPLAGGTAEQLYFRSPTVGFAVVSDAKGGRIYRTTDGAGSWTEVGSSPANLAEPIYAVYFASASKAYAVGGGASVPFLLGGNGTFVLVSEDEGTTWKPVSESPPAEIKLPEGTPLTALHQIICSDPKTCLLATGTSQLVRTADGAETGTLVAPGEAPIASIAFAAGLGVVGVGDGGTTVLSPDGGATFPTQVSHRLGLELQPQVRLGATPQLAYVAARGGRIAVTGDGGAEWGTVHVPTTADVLDVSFPGAQTGYAVDSRGTLFRTANGGQTWAIEGGGESPSRLLAPNATTVLRIGPTGLRRSTDAGASFTAVGGSVVVGHRKHRPVRRSLSSFPLFAGAQMAGGAIIAWGDEAIESLDGGASWRAIPRPLTGAGIEDVSFVSPSVGYVVSRQRLFFTRNAGRSWSEIASLGTGALGGEGMLSFSSARDGYALTAWSASENVLLRTSDGGHSWTPELLPRHLVSVVAGGAVDYAAGAGALFATTTGGAVPARSSLKLTITGARRLTRARLHKLHGRVRLSGRLAPAQGGETIRIAYRPSGRAVWRSVSVTAASDGSFSATVGGISASTDFVAQWAGEGGTAGAGSAAARLTVGRR